MITVAIWVGGHDGSITILENEKLLAFLPEERFSKKKYDSSIPFISLQKILKFTNKIDNLIIAGTEEDILILNHLKKLNIHFKTYHKTPQSSHHINHASSGFFGSGFKDALCLTIDSFGGSNLIPNTNQKSVDTTNYYYVKNPHTFKLLYSNRYYNPSLFTPYPKEYISNDNIDLNYNLDIGMMYGSVCHFLGWSNLEAGKLMGLSSYGSPNKDIPEILFKDTLYANMNLFNSSYNLNYPFISILKEAKSNPNSNIAKDLAYLTQNALEYVIYNRINQALQKHPTNNIVISGGCSLNVVNNYKLKKLFPKINFYMDPLGSDLGQSYGIAKYYYYQITKSTKLEPLQNLYHGPRYSKKSLLNLIKKYV